MLITQGDFWDMFTASFFFAAQMLWFEIFFNVQVNIKIMFSTMFFFRATLSMSRGDTKFWFSNGNTPI